MGNLKQWRDAGIPILQPGTSDIVVFLVDLPFDVLDLILEQFRKHDVRETSTYAQDLHWTSARILGDCEYIRRTKGFERMVSR